MARAATATDVFRALADPTRRALLMRLRREECAASDLATPFEMSRPAISQHLRILREADLIRVDRVGRHRVYRVHPEPLRLVRDWVAHFEVLDDPQGHAWMVGKVRSGATPEEVQRARLERIAAGLRPRAPSPPRQDTPKRKTAEDRTQNRTNRRKERWPSKEPTERTGTSRPT